MTGGKWGDGTPEHLAPVNAPPRRADDPDLAAHDAKVLASTLLEVARRNLMTATEDVRFCEIELGIAHDNLREAADSFAAATADLERAIVLVGQARDLSPVPQDPPRSP
jgi:hypothetical protein